MYFPQKMTYNLYNQKQLNVKIKKQKTGTLSPDIRVKHASANHSSAKQI